MTVAEKIKKETKSCSPTRFWKAATNAVKLNGIHYRQLSVVEAIFIDGSVLTVRVYFWG